jgi:hypothetical protein
VEPKAGSQISVMAEISQILTPVAQIEEVDPGYPGRNITQSCVTPRFDVDKLFPPSLVYVSERYVVEISIPTKETLDRKWFVNLLGGEKASYRLIATKDIDIIYLEI